MATLRMSVKERRRLELFGKVKRKEMKLRKAAELLGLGYRQAKRSYARYLEVWGWGPGASIAGPAIESPRRRAASRCDPRGGIGSVTSISVRRWRRSIWRRTGFEVSVATLRRWLVTEKLWQPGCRGSATSIVATASFLDVRRAGSDGRIASRLVRGSAGPRAVLMVDDRRRDEPDRGAVLQIGVDGVGNDGGASLREQAWFAAGVVRGSGQHFSV